MKINILLIFLLILPHLTFSQKSADIEVFARILQYESRNGNFYPQCQKIKTYFDLKEFKEQYDYKVPEKILEQLADESCKSQDSEWESEAINALTMMGYLRCDRCLTKAECESLFETTGRRQRIVSVSDPIFDLKRENSVVSATYWSFYGSVSGYSYFLKKVYGQWTVIFTYGHWIT